MRVRAAFSSEPLISGVFLIVKAVGVPCLTNNSLTVPFESSPALSIWKRRKFFPMILCYVVTALTSFVPRSALDLVLVGNNV